MKAYNTFSPDFYNQTDLNLPVIFLIEFGLIINLMRIKFNYNFLKGNALKLFFLKDTICIIKKRVLFTLQGIIY